MTYDLSNWLCARQARGRLETLIQRGATIELSQKSPRRTLPQNAYLHLLLSYFATQYGETLSFVKEYFYKRTACPELYLQRKDDPLLGSVSYTRSSATLSKEEMARSIERFKDWSAREAGILLPEADDEPFLVEAQAVVQQHKQWL